jgi:hypothetical protein
MKMKLDKLPEETQIVLANDSCMWAFILNMGTEIEWILQVKVSFQGHEQYQYTNVFLEYLLELWCIS